VAKQLIKMLKSIPKNVFLALVLFLVAIALLNSEKQRMDLRTLGIQAQIKTDQETIYKLEQLTQERPNYRDGWIQLAVAYYKNNDKDRALEALQKAKQIDPNNETLSQVEELWNN